MKTLTVQIPEQVTTKLNRTDAELSRDLKLYTALMLYQLGKVSSGLASKMAGIPRVQFLELCGEYGISVFRYTPEQLEAEFAYV